MAVEVQAECGGGGVVGGQAGEVGEKQCWGVVAWCSCGESARRFSGRVPGHGGGMGLL